MSENFSYLSNAAASTIDELYQTWLKNPDEVEESWRKFFEGFEFARATFHESEESTELFSQEFRVLNLINGYRSRGHLFTHTNPVRKRRDYSPTLDYHNFGLEDSDLETTFKAGNEIGIGPAKLKDIISHLEDTYCGSIGVEYYYIRDPEKIEWLNYKIEHDRNIPDFSTPIKKHIFFKLNQAVGFEQFLQKKYLGQKRFSLEGAESVIPALDAVIEKGASLGTEEFIIGMPHRGRLNVLANILNKSYTQLFSEFEGFEYSDDLSLGDVKYHLGYTADVVSRKGQIIKLSLSPNPSHLETVGPVVTGMTRAKIDQEYKGNHEKITSILLHGDAAVAGQGVVYEEVQMAGLKGYKVGGTIHLVINNQVGFTTDYKDARTSTYCTDVAKATLSPVFHINGDDVEALVYTIEMAMEYRQKFHSDVFIDILCYRRHGHNESDEPRFTQPTLYRAISQHPDTRQIYAEKLIRDNVLTDTEVNHIKQQFEEMLQDRLLEARKKGLSLITNIFENKWEKLRKAKPEDFDKSPDTGVGKKQLLQIAERMTAIPKDIAVFRKARRIVESRLETIKNNPDKIDWAIAEHLAFGSILLEGNLIRFTGQDVGRGTFSHRHAVLSIEDSDDKFIPLQHLDPDQERFEIYNSPLNEYAVLGFEYGYSLVYPNDLTLWEAQFGDFANGAQIIFDQYISSAEDKWKIQSGIVALLPHGFEGQGPEHSSARIERFLTLCGDNNLQIVNCTTPANYFHVLRRQLKRDFRKPLIIFTPKSLLRHPQCISHLDELAKGRFTELYDETYLEKPDEINKVVFCSGKLYYDLLEERGKRNITDTAIIRMEQIYPVPYKHIEAIKKKYKKAGKWLWVQEEPENMGPWPFIMRKLPEMKFTVVARKESGSPAGGLVKKHIKRHKRIMELTFGKL